MKPVIGITCDVQDGDPPRCALSTHYARSIIEAGGTPILLAPDIACIPEYLRICDGFLFSGGGDPIMPHWGIAMHPEAKPVSSLRQSFELALLDALQARPEAPALGVCLGMQMMGLHAGGTLEQHLPDTLQTASHHRNRSTHEVTSVFGTGTVHSHHHQALTDGGSLEVAARSADGVIEAVRDGKRPFYVGVQWHPERTNDDRLGQGIIRALVNAARARINRQK